MKFTSIVMRQEEGLWVCETKFVVDGVEKVWDTATSHETPEGAFHGAVGWAREAAVTIAAEHAQKGEQ